ncbi:hypothetical protein [Nostoc sp. C110]
MQGLQSFAAVQGKKGAIAVAEMELVIRTSVLVSEILISKY